MVPGLMHSRLLYFIVVASSLCMQCAGFSNPLAIVGARSAIAHGAGQHLRVRSMFGGRVPRSCGSSSLLRGPARQGGVLAAGMQSSAEEQGFKKLYRVEDEKIKHTVILPIGEETTSREIECTITKTCLLLSVDGKRVIVLEGTWLTLLLHL